jgi:endonuclease YncB( thermonuclease family)
MCPAAGFRPDMMAAVRPREITMKPTSRTITILLIIACIAAGAAMIFWNRHTEQRCDVRTSKTCVIDGDTIAVLVDGKIEKVRYIGMDTPETVHPTKPVGYCGHEASAMNKKMVEGKPVRLEYDVERRDKYGRLLAYVFVSDEHGKEIFVNTDLVRAGMARAYPFEPNVRHARQFATLELEARNKSLGMWGLDTCKSVGH